MARLTFDQVARLALDAGFRANDGSAATAVAIAMAESGFNADVMGDAQYGGSVGLWQINLPAHPQYAAYQLQDPVTNAHAAYVTSKSGTNFNPWCTYKPSACSGAGNNAYTRYLDEARAAVARAVSATSWQTAAVAGTAVAGALGLAWWLKKRFLG